MNNLVNQIHNFIDIKGILNIIIDRFFENDKSANNFVFKKLIDISNGFNDLKTFIQYLDLGSVIDTYQSDLENVALMTLHAAKGLEFPCVFITGCEEGLLPYSLIDNDKSNIEEERRLLYVGMTRAKRYLFITHANKRFINNREYHLKRCSFLDNIEHQLIELSKDEYKKKMKQDNDQLSLF